MPWTEKRSTYFCVDIEANGPVPGLFDMVSVGAVAVVGADDQGVQLRAAEQRPDKPCDVRVGLPVSSE